MSWNAYGKSYRCIWKVVSSTNLMPGQTFNAPPTSGPTGPQFSSHGSHDGEEVPSNAFDRINLHERNDTNGIVNSEQMRSTRRNLAGPSHQHSFPLPATMIEAIPSPQPKVHYEAPVFRTFQERKRANDTSALGDGPSKPRPTPDPSTLAMMGHAAQALPKASTPPVANGRSQVTNHVSAPSWPQAVHPPPRAGPSRPLPRPSQPSPFPVVNRPPPPPLQASLERSDTISSIKSLDRMGFATPGKRPLPQTPVMVNSSKSLDRGTPSRLGPGGKRDWSRKQPSVVSEEDTDGSETSSPVFPIQLLSPAPPTIIFPPTINTPPVIVEPEDEKASSPAKSIQLPTINLPDSDPVEETTTVSETTSGVAFSGLPVIAVSSEETPPMEPEAKSSPLNGAILCAGCCNPIIGRIVNAMSQRWHPRCFKCDQCGELLEHVSSYEWDGKAYCHLDYHDVSFQTNTDWVLTMIEIRISMFPLQDPNSRCSLRDTR